MTWIAQKLLTAIGQASPDECITEVRLVELTRLEAKQVENAALTLRRRELATRVGPGCLKLTDAGREALAAGATITSGPNGPQPGKRIFTDTLRSRIWTALRIRQKASIPDLIMLTAQGNAREKALESNIGKYLRALAKAGFVSKMPRREPGTAITSNGYVRWLLIRNTGPLAPVWRPGKSSVYDPNTTEEHSYVDEPA